MDYPYFEREDSGVDFVFESGLGTCDSVIAFRHNCEEDQEYAELMARHFNERMDDLFRDVALNPLPWLSPSEISALKRRLKNWHAGEHRWID